MQFGLMHWQHRLEKRRAKDRPEQLPNGKSRSSHENAYRRGQEDITLQRVCISMTNGLSYGHHLQLVHGRLEAAPGFQDMSAGLFGC